MGIRRETVTDVSQRLLAHHGGLRGLFRLDVAELARVRGLGDAKAVRVKAALELGRRLAALSPEERPPVGSPEDVANLLGIEMAALSRSSCGWCCWIPSTASWAPAPSIKAVSTRRRSEWPKSSVVNVRIPGRLPPPDSRPSRRYFLR
jgi:hypothetical protein